MINGTGVKRRRRRRALTVIGLGVITALAAAVPALAHPVFSNDAPGFPNPQGGTADPYPGGSRPTLNMYLPFEQDGVIFNGAGNTTVDVKVTVPTGWTTPACAAASTSVGNRQVGTVVPGWVCAIETAGGHQVLHWTGPQISPTQTFADSAQFLTFQATVPSPATNTGYGATDSPAEGFYVEQAYADGSTSLWRTPNSTRPGEIANGIVRTVAATPTPTPVPPTPTRTPSLGQGGGGPTSPPAAKPSPTGQPTGAGPSSGAAQNSATPTPTGPTLTGPPEVDPSPSSAVEQLTQRRDDATSQGVRWQILVGGVLAVMVVVGTVIAVMRWRRRSS